MPLTLSRIWVKSRSFWLKRANLCGNHLWSFCCSKHQISYRKRHTSRLTTSTNCAVKAKDIFIYDEVDIRNIAFLIPLMKRRDPLQCLYIAETWLRLGGVKARKNKCTWCLVITWCVAVTCPFQKQKWLHKQILFQLSAHQHFFN